MSDKSWLDNLSEILSKPLPGTESTASKSADAQAGKPASDVFHDDDDDDSLLDRITDILSKPLPGTEQPAPGTTATADSPTSTPAAVEPENPGETAVREASDNAADDEDPVSTTATAGADWMQREYERFNQHQDANRRAFSEQQRLEQERFAAYQRAQLDRFMQSQERERDVFRHHQAARSQAWRQDLRHNYAPAPPGMRPPPPPPPPPPWWRKR